MDYNGRLLETLGPRPTTIPFAQYNPNMARRTLVNDESPSEYPGVLRRAHGVTMRPLGAACQDKTPSRAPRWPKGALEGDILNGGWSLRPACTVGPEAGSKEKNLEVGRVPGIGPGPQGPLGWGWVPDTNILQALCGHTKIRLKPQAEGGRRRGPGPPLCLWGLMRAPTGPQTHHDGTV